MHDMYIWFPHKQMPYSKLKLQVPEKTRFAYQFCISGAMALPGSLLTYPSQSLQFLKTLHACPTTAEVAHACPVPVSPASLKLDIIVIGAGLGGLAVAVALARRGHSVRVLEQAPVLGEVSNTRANIQLSLKLDLPGRSRYSDSPECWPSASSMGGA